MTRIVPRMAALLAAAVCPCLPALADPPTSETVLRPGVASSAHVYIEPHLGLNVTFMSADAPFRAQIPGEGDLDIYRSATGLAPLAGVTFGYQFSPTGGVELDLSFDSRRASNSGATADNCARYDPAGNLLGVSAEPANKEYTIGADYFSLGLAGTFSVEQFIFFLGPTVSIPLSSTVEERLRWSEADTECRYFFGTADESMEIVGTVVDSAGQSTFDAATRVSLRVGAGAAIAVSSAIDLVPRVGFDIGLTDAFESSSTSFSNYTVRKEGTNTSNYFGTTFNSAINLSSLQASLGLRIKL